MALAECPLIVRRRPAQIASRTVGGEDRLLGQRASGDSAPSERLQSCNSEASLESSRSAVLAAASKMRMSVHARHVSTGASLQSFLASVSAAAHACGNRVAWRVLKDDHRTRTARTRGTTQGRIQKALSSDCFARPSVPHPRSLPACFSPGRPRGQSSPANRSLEGLTAVVGLHPLSPILAVYAATGSYRRCTRTRDRAELPSTVTKGARRC